MNRRNLLVAGASALVFGRSAIAQSATPASAGDAVYRIDLAPEWIPTAQVVIGAVNNVLAAGSTATYPTGGSPESLAIEYVISGDYRATAAADMEVIRADGATESVPAGQEVEVAAGDALIVIDNEEELDTGAGDEDVVSLILGIFTLGQGSGEMIVEGDLGTEFLAAGPALTLPGDGVTVELLEGAADASAWPDALLVLPVTTIQPAADWTFVVLPTGSPAATPDS